MHAICGSDKEADKAACLGYVMGGLDSAIIMQAAGNLRVICPPELASKEQVRDVVVDYLYDHPEARHKQS